MKDGYLEPIFLQTDDGPVFVLFRAPIGASHCVLFVPPFAEEMNKARRQYAVTARALAEKGFASLIVDLFGTGDSAGEFSDATWPMWKGNLLSAIAWAQEKGVVVDKLVAARLGCVLAAESLGEAAIAVEKTVFWQPVASGMNFMTQFLRLRVAASLMEDDNKESVKDLKACLESGETLEVAGYELSPQLWSSIEQGDLLRDLSQNLGQMMIAEVGRVRADGLSPAGRKVMAAAEQTGVRAQGCRVEGEPFWSSTEIVTNDQLSQKTVEFLVAGA